MNTQGMAGQQEIGGSPANFLQNVPLAPYTTMGVGGPARWFVTASTEQQVAAAVAFARERSLPVFVIGGGSNLLVRDAGFPGLVLHIALQGIRTQSHDSDGAVRVTAAAGESWDDFVQFAVHRDLQGVECLAGIPGTVGGTPVQNVGAYGQEVSQTLVEARCFDMATGRYVCLRQAEFGFGYRTSLLNGAARDRYVITEVTFALRVGGAPTLTFPELRKAVEGRVETSLAQVADQVRRIRRRKGMVLDPADPDSRSAGSFFRNPIVPADVLFRVSESTGVPADQVPHWPAAEDRIKLPAAWLLERAGFERGTVMGRAGISSKHTLALINRGDATERDIAALREHIVTGVETRFGITLEQEPVNVG